MKTLDLASGLFWLFLSSAAFVGSLRMGIGTAQSPGMGFMPAGASAVLGILSLVLLVKAIIKNMQDVTVDATAAILGKKALMVLIAVVIYSIVMPTLGYLIGTFLLMTFLYWFLEQNGIKGLLRGAVISLLTTVASYYLFAVLLHCSFPVGILNF
jgi:putative tricarboxylic transport membrane protein